MIKYQVECVNCRQAYPIELSKYDYDRHILIYAQCPICLQEHYTDEYERIIPEHQCQYCEDCGDCHICCPL